ncbi:MAG: biosynthetic arginine decarboxylase [Lentisphaeria bacterium]
MNKQIQRWNVNHSADLYGINNWGKDYFGISSEGEVTLNNEKGGTLSLLKVVEELRERGTELPVLLRFDNILKRQITRINESFSKAIANNNYQGVYRGVYPVKVNQQQHIVQEVVKLGRPYNYGLEAGSKAELMAAISCLDNNEACLICNGYKDSEFIDLGLYARKMGMRCVFVIETPSEVPLIIERSKALKIEPILGVRLKLSSQAGGKWTESGGDRSVFGLNTAQALEVVDQLRSAEMLHCMQLLHYHLGSQIPNIRDIRQAVTEASRIYVGLVEEGAPMGYFDMGGGMAIDYDGSSTNYASSCNYKIDEYCQDVIEIIKSVMDEKNIAHPNIVTEFGRATVAYCSVLVFNVLDVSRFTPKRKIQIPENPHEQISNLLDVDKEINARNLQECYHDAVYYRDELRQLFKHGNVTLRERALGESIFWNIMQKIHERVKNLDYVPEEFHSLASNLADIYYGNFSIFQSVPDSWAIDQLFPIMPIHRLKEKPDNDAIISDITCDCDGVIDKFIDLRDVKYSLPLHDLKEDDEYYIGIFLVGAYQETLGDLHNLFGDTNVASIDIAEDGSYTVLQDIEGDSVEEVLSYVEYDIKGLLQRIKTKAEQAISDNLITPRERRKIIDAFSTGLRGYTYYES